MRANFSNLIWYLTKNKHVSKVVHGHATYHEIKAETTEFKGLQEGIEQNGLIMLFRKLEIKDELIIATKSTGAYSGFYFVLEGAFQFKAEDNASPILIPSGTFLPVDWTGAKGNQKITGQNFCALEVYFSNAFLEGLLGKEFQLGAFFTNLSGRINENFPIKPISKKLQNSLLGIVNCPYEGSAKISYLECKIRWMLIDLLLGSERYENETDTLGLPKSEYQSIQKVARYIAQNIKQPLTIKELSEVAGFNTTKLKNNFKKVHETTIFKYITNLRMEKAKTLIVDGCTIAEASYEVGYANPQHFTVAFKKTMGYLPSQLKEL